MILGLFETNPQIAVVLILTLVFSLSFHEFAHAYLAYKLGDNTAAFQGRLTLNPLAHLDPIGSLMLLFIGFGYAKPVPVNPMNLHNPKEDMMKVAFAGPASNLFLCLIGCFLIRLVGFGGDQLYNIGYLNPVNQLGLMLWIFSSINMTLAVFNLIPIHPLDGGQIFGNYLDRINPDFSYKLRVYGPKILMGIIFFGILTGFSVISILISPFRDLVAILSGIK